MNQLFLMGVLYRLGNLTEQGQSLLNTEPGPVLLYEVVQPNGIRVVLEDQCRAALVILVLQRTQQPRVMNPFQDLKLALGGPTNCLAIGRGGTQRNGVETDATLDPLQRDVCPFVVLVRRALEQQRAKLVVADAA